MHLEPGCPEFKYAQKYKYYETIVVHNAAEAIELDKKYRPCPRCQKKLEKELERERKGNQKRGYRKAFGSVQPLDYN
jgi:hypothetical protein